MLPRSDLSGENRDVNIGIALPYQTFHSFDQVDPQDPDLISQGEFRKDTKALKQTDDGSGA